MLFLWSVCTQGQEAQGSHTMAYESPHQSIKPTSHSEGSPGFEYWCLKKGLVTLLGKGYGGAIVDGWTSKVPTNTNQRLVAVNLDE